jgi:hypothetical protein
MSDEPIVVGELHLECYQHNGPERATLCNRALSERASMPWSDWVALARKILEREGCVVAERGHPLSIFPPPPGYMYVLDPDYVRVDPPLDSAFVRAVEAEQDRP